MSTAGKKRSSHGLNVFAFGCAFASAMLIAAQTQPGDTGPASSLKGAAPANSGISGPGGHYAPGATVLTRQARRPGPGGAVDAGLIPDIRPLFDLQIRDTVINTGPDGMYYLCGSTGQVFAHNDGIELWRSPDLKNWDYVGLVWSFAKDATWQKAGQVYQNQNRNIIWAPEIWYLNKNFYLTYSLPPGNRGILKSSTGKPEGPYVNALANDGKFTGDIDASFFQDDDGKIYLVYGGVWVARMKDDMSGLDEEPKKPALLNPDKNPAHHAATCPPRRDCTDVGREGGFIFKRNGIYYLTAADTYDGRYSSMVATSDNIYGPYKNRHEAVPTGGGTNYFKDKDGNWFCCYFGNDGQSPFREMPAMIKVDFDKDNTIFIADEQPEWLLRAGASAKWRKAPRVPYLFSAIPPATATAPKPLTAPQFEVILQSRILCHIVKHTLLCSPFSALAQLPTARSLPLNPPRTGPNQ